MRITSIDGFRGICLVSMALAHFKTVLNSHYVGDYTHHSLGFVDGASGFVSLSGFVVGLVFGKRILNSRELAAQKIRKRVLDIFLWHLALIAYATFTVTVIAPEGPLWDSRWGDMPLLAAALSIFTLMTPLYLGVLPIYLTFLALTYQALKALSEGKILFVAGLSLSAWFFAQTQFSNAILWQISDATGLIDHGIQLGLGFNRWAWQLLYFGGLILGFLMAKGDLKLEFLHATEGRIIYNFCVGALIFFAVMRLSQVNGIFENAGSSHVDKSNLGILRLLNFVAFSFIVVRLLAVSRFQPSGISAHVGRFLHRISTWSPLVFLGQHSLQVFCYHILLYYTLRAFFPHGVQTAPQSTKEMLMILCVLSMWAAAWLNKTYRTQKQRLLSPTNQI